MTPLLKLRYLVVLAVAFASAGSLAARADSITFYNTGVGANGVVLSAGTADPNYTLIYSADSNGTVSQATNPNPAWVGNTATAGWISPGSDGNTNWASGYYVYETTLDLTGYDPTTASLSGDIAADDNVSIYLNRGGSALFSSTGFSSMTPFLINSGFVSGVNLVDFVIYNNAGPTGLMVDDTQANATAVTPEPGTWLLLGTGAALGVVQRMRRGQTLPS